MVMKLVVVHVLFFAVATVFVVHNTDFNREPSSMNSQWSDPYRFMKL